MGLWPFEEGGGSCSHGLTFDYYFFFVFQFNLIWRSNNVGIFFFMVSSGKEWSELI